MRLSLSLVLGLVFLSNAGCAVQDGTESPCSNATNVDGRPQADLNGIHLYRRLELEMVDHEEGDEYLYDCCFQFVMQDIVFMSLRDLNGRDSKNSAQKDYIFCIMSDKIDDLKANFYGTYSDKITICKKCHSLLPFYKNIFDMAFKNGMDTLHTIRPATIVNESMYSVSSENMLMFMNDSGEGIFVEPARKSAGDVNDASESVLVDPYSLLPGNLVAFRERVLDLVSEDLKTIRPIKDVCNEQWQVKIKGVAGVIDSSPQKTSIKRDAFLTVEKIKSPTLTPVIVLRKPFTLAVFNIKESEVSIVSEYLKNKYGNADDLEDTDESLESMGCFDTISISPDISSGVVPEDTERVKKDKPSQPTNEGTSGLYYVGGIICILVLYMAGYTVYKRVTST